MSKQEQQTEQTVETQDEIKQQDAATQEAPAAEEQAEAPAEEAENETEEAPSELDQVKAQLEASQKEYLFLMAEFDNYRKRTLKEKADLIKNGGERAMLELLPVVDDFERALQAIETSEDVEGVKEGVKLIYNKFLKLSLIHI